MSKRFIIVIFSDFDFYFLLGDVDEWILKDTTRCESERFNMQSASLVISNRKRKLQK